MLVLGKDQGSRVLFHYCMEADLPPTQKPAAGPEPRSRSSFQCCCSSAPTGGFYRGTSPPWTLPVEHRAAEPQLAFTLAGALAGSYLADLLAQHGGAGVDDEHHVLGDDRQVFGGEVVDKVSI